MTNAKKILVVGGGVIGLNVAARAIAAGHKVTIWSLEGAGDLPNTSASAYALWVPCYTADPRVLQIANDTRDELTALASDPATGVELRTAIVLKEHVTDEPWYKDTAGYRRATAEERTDAYADGFAVDNTPVIDPSKYLAWLRAEVIAAGVVIEQRKLESFADVPAEFDAIVNCTGLGTRALTGDTTIVPERVQVVRVRNTKNRHITATKTDDDGPNKRCCVVPHGDYITIGAHFDGPHETFEPDASQVQNILDRAMRMEPGLRVGLEDVVEVRRALRPERSTPWIEKTTTADGRLLVHATGHNGMGYLTSIGTAKVVEQYLQ